MLQLPFLTFVVVVLVGLVAGEPIQDLPQDRPNIVFIVSDDLGFNDVSFHGSQQIPTPNIDGLAKGGVILHHYYVQPVCSPTRATFMTGRSVIHTGVYDPMNGGSGDLSLNFSLWSEGFRNAGYATHAVGKWHLGMSSWRFTPMQRSFDSYYGYLGGAEDYWTHFDGRALDLFDDYDAVTNVSCRGGGGDSCPEHFYSASLFTARAQRVLRDHAAAQGTSTTPKPLFLYLAYQSVHSPDEAPQHLIDRFNATIPNEHRRTFAGMVTALDQGVGEVVSTLHETGLYNSTLIVFSTDNGGPADGFNGNMACNWPLRGMKRTLFEGGVRGVGLVHGAGLRRVGWRATGFVHAADWFHSLLRFAVQGISSSLRGNASAPSFAPSVRALLPSTEPPFLPGDGMDVWDYLSGSRPDSPRTLILHEAHPPNSTDGNGEALRVGDLKVVIRSGDQWSRGSNLGSNDGWFGGPGSSDTKTGAYCVLPNAPPLAVTCPTPPLDFTRGFACEQNKSAACLFNISADPCEQHDLSASHPTELSSMLEQLASFRAHAVISTSAHPNPDHRGCPYITKAPGGMKAWTPCLNNGSHPSPSPSPPDPDRHQLRHTDGANVLCLGDNVDKLSSCGPSTKVWSTGRDGRLMVGKSILKIYEIVSSDWLAIGDNISAHPTGSCQQWSQLHLGVNRGDGNAFVIQNSSLRSGLCPGRCAALLGKTEVGLVNCSDSASVQGWSIGD